MITDELETNEQADPNALLEAATEDDTGAESVEEEGQTLTLGPFQRWHLYQAFTGVGADSYAEYQRMNELHQSILPGSTAQKILQAIQRGGGDETIIQHVEAKDFDFGEPERSLIGRALWSFIRKQELDPNRKIPRDPFFQQLHDEFLDEIEAARAETSRAETEGA